MKNVSLTRAEAALFLVTLIVPLMVESLLALTAFPELRWLLPTSMLFPAGLLAGVAMRGGSGRADIPATRYRGNFEADASSATSHAG